MDGAPNPTLRSGDSLDAAGVLDVVAGRVPLFAAALEAHRHGRLSQARGAYVELVDQPGLTALCLHQLAVTAGQAGDHRRAAELLRCVLRIEPEQPLFHQNLAVSLERQGRLADALDALVDLGAALHRAEKYRQAVAVYRRVLAADPRRYAAWVNLGTALACLNAPRSAVKPLLRAVALHASLLPDLAGLLRDMLPTLTADGVAPADLAEWREQPTGNVTMIEQALATLGKVLNELGYRAEALATYRMAVTLAPGLALGHWNLALALLASGDFGRGWREYEWRWQWDKFPERRVSLPAPQWRGERLAGKAVLVYAEQGFGDTIQFAPLVLHLAKTARRVTLQVPSPLLRLLRQSFDGAIDVVARGAEAHDTRGSLDYVVPLMSLPALLGLTLADLPLVQGYLKPADCDRAVWRERLPMARHLKVGIVWAGRPSHVDDRKRSLPLHRLAPLFDIEGVVWYSLQLDKAREQLAAAGGSVIDLASELSDFADTAAAVAELDLVIAVDTAVAHLAAAMGRPVWLLVPAVADWRWLVEGDESPWYPTLRLFRQERAGDWKSVVDAVCRSLERKIVAARRHADA